MPSKNHCVPDRLPGLCLKAAWTLVLALPLSASWAAGDIEAGKAAFVNCASCHALGPSAHGAFGPQLNALIGRTAGSTADYHYSAAMKNSGIVWSEKTLTAFLKDPGDVVPGTKMRLYGFSNEQKIANLLAYLRTFN